MRGKRLACALAALLVLCSSAGAAPLITGQRVVQYFPNVSSPETELSGNGRYVVYNDEENGFGHVQRIDLVTWEVVSIGVGSPIGGYQSAPRISDDGMTVVFTHQAGFYSGPDDGIGVWRQGWSRPTATSR